MKRIRLLVLVAGLAPFSPGWLLAQVPQLLNYQGRVTVGGTNFDGVAQFKFALVNPAGTINHWSNDGRATGQPNLAVPVPVAQGLYSVLLGDPSVSGMSVPIPATVFTNADVRLRVWFNDGAAGFQQLVPDQRVAPVGYALVAASLDPLADVRARRLLIGSDHLLTGVAATIAGGAQNSATNDYTTIGGGLGNLASGGSATVSGGVTNSASGFESTVGGGELNVASGTVATVGGGYANLASGFEATVAGGELNGATGVVSSVGGGYANLASGLAATIPGGYANLASGDYALAAGAGAMATHAGAFVWADASTTNVVRSTANHQFSARAAGGVRFYSNSAATTGVQLAAGANAWSAASDRHLKENLRPVDVRTILAQLLATPITEWNLISQDPAIRHLGPMAQDFHAAFGLGEDDRHISSTDADGVAFAAIQGLYEIIQEKDARIAALERRLEALETRWAPAALPVPSPTDTAASGASSLPLP